MVVVVGKKEMEVDTLISIRVAAQWLNVHECTVRRMISRREITAYKVQGSVKVSSESIRTYLESNRIDTAEVSENEGEA